MKIKITIVFLLFGFLYSTAKAAETVYNYPAPSIYLSAYRFLTLEKHYKVTDKNPEMGVIKFMFNEAHAKDKNGSIEIIKNAAGKGSHRVRLRLPSLTEGTAMILMNELGKRIKKDFAPASFNERVFEDYNLESISSSVYRFISVDKNYKIIKFDEENGIIHFTTKKGKKEPDSHVEIFSMPRQGHKVRLVISALSQSSVGIILGEISEKLRSDYKKGG